MMSKENKDFYKFKTEKKNQNGLEKILRGLMIKTYICLLHLF